MTRTIEISRGCATPPASVHRRLVFLKTIIPRSLSGCWLCSDASRASSRALDLNAVGGRPSRTFPCSYEPLSARDPRCRRRNEAAAPIASSSFAAADGVRGRLRDGPRPALRGRALRAPPRKSWPAPFSAGNSALSALSRVLLGDRTCLCLPNTRPRTHPPRHPARRRPRCCRPASSL